MSRVGPGRAFARRVARGLAYAMLAGAWAWSAGMLAFAPYSTPAVRATLATGFLIALPVAWRALRRRLGPARTLGTLALLACVPILAWSLAGPRPSNERTWSPDQARLPRVRIEADRVAIANVRHAVYRASDDYDVRWEDRDYDLSRIETLWFAVEPFAGLPGAAHTFLSFGFDDGRYLAVSAEIRKERGESFSPAKGLYRNYELMYVLGDERDLVLLRTQHRKDEVFLYPVKATPAQVRAVFLDVLARVQTLAREPEFYHSATNTCTTNIVDHANRLQPGSVPLSWKLLLPGHSDALALERGLIDFDGTLVQARARFRINERAALAARSQDFSAAIRRF